jgi:hypothetical protein
MIRVVILLQLLCLWKTLTSPEINPETGFVVNEEISTIPVDIR